MTHLDLKRISYAQEATYGALIHEQIPFTLTLEDPWLDNRVNVSCIPPGYYECQRVNSPHHGDTFQVLNVIGRTHILFHRGNTSEDTEGCILLGEQFDPIDGREGISYSGAGYAEFHALLAGENEFSLLVIAP